MSCLINPSKPRAYLADLPEALSVGFLITKSSGAINLINMANGKPGGMPAMRMGPWGAAALFATAAVAVWEHVNASDQGSDVLPTTALIPNADAPSLPQQQTTTVALSESPTTVSATAVEYMHLIMESGTLSQHLVALIKQILDGVNAVLSREVRDLISSVPLTQQQQDQIISVKRRIRELRVVERDVAEHVVVILRSLGIDALRALYSLPTMAKVVDRVLELVRERKFASSEEQDLLWLPMYANANELKIWRLLLEKVQQYVQSYADQVGVSSPKVNWVAQDLQDVYQHLQDDLQRQRELSPEEPPQSQEDPEELNRRVAERLAKYAANRAVTSARAKPVIRQKFDCTSRNK